MLSVSVGFIFIHIPHNCLGLWQSYDCPSVSELIRVSMDEMDRYQNTTKRRICNIRRLHIPEIWRQPLTPFNNISLWSQHGYLITYPVICGMRLPFYGQTLMVAPLKFHPALYIGCDYTCNYLYMLESMLIPVSKMAQQNVDRPVMGFHQYVHISCLRREVHRKGWSTGSWQDVFIESQSILDAHWGP